MNRYITEKDFREIRAWVSRNARVLDFALWQYHFEGGSKDAVLSALSYYQNDDGGFGNAIEPDNWNPESTPYAVDYAIKMLRQIDFYDLEHPLYQGALRFLKDTPYQDECGWFFTIPSNDDHPHAVWWQYSVDENKVQSIGTSASLVGFILRYVPAGTGLYQKALVYADKLMTTLKATDNYGDMGLVGFCDLYRDLRAAKLETHFDMDFLAAKTKSLLQEKLREISWSNHLDMAVVLPNPSSVYYPGHEDAVAASLDELIQRRAPGGVWDIPWNWYDGGAFAGEFAISENWWKANKAVERLLFLKAYGRVDGQKMA